MWMRRSRQLWPDLSLKLKSANVPNLHALSVSASCIEVIRPKARNVSSVLVNLLTTHEKNSLSGTDVALW